jgi:hypothetical protein
MRGDINKVLYFSTNINAIQCFENSFEILKKSKQLYAVAHASNLSYSEGGNWEDHGLRPASVKMGFYLKNNLKAKIAEAWLKW